MSAISPKSTLSIRQIPLICCGLLLLAAELQASCGDYVVVGKPRRSVGMPMQDHSSHKMAWSRHGSAPYGVSKQDLAQQDLAQQDLAQQDLAQGRLVTPVRVRRKPTCNGPACEGREPAPRSKTALQLDEITFEATAGLCRFGFDGCERQQRRLELLTPSSRRGFPQRIQRPPRG